MDAIVTNTDSKTSCYPSFDFNAESFINSLGIRVQEFTHKTTNAKHYHIANSDEHQVFMVAFRTIPQDNTGIAHILEHTVLCGSEKYPVRDPFFMMLRRSLSTFMNAFTSSDWTAYPFATLNKKDFDNLLSVYLDAAFFPKIHPLDFAQEGHRLEFKKPTDKTLGLEYKGVVFNEMKGAMSSITSTLWQKLTANLFPTNTYHYNSGGEPEAILDLTHRQLVEFHEHHYHPSNAVFLTYGNQKVSELQEKFEQLVLSSFSDQKSTVLVSDEITLPASVEVRDYYSSTEENVANECHFLMGWKLPHSSDMKNLLRAELLSSYLLSNSASPLMDLLETTKLAKSCSPICGLETDMKEMVLAFGVQGIAENDIPELKQQIIVELKRIVSEPIDKSLFTSVLHQFELTHREISGGSYPYGLQLILGLLPSTLHGGNPLTALDIDTTLAELKIEIEDDNFIPSLVQKWLLDNTHNVNLTLVPSTTLQQEKQAKELAKLNSICLSDVEADKLILDTVELQKRQASIDDYEVLPRVTLQDVSPDIRSIKSIDLGNKVSFPITCYNQPTNGLAYESLYISLPELTDTELKYLNLFCNYLTEVGANSNNYRQTQLDYALVTGGINAGYTINSSYDEIDKTVQYFVLSSKALYRNRAAMQKLMVDMLSTVDFSDMERLKDLLMQTNANNLRSIAQNGHMFAMQTASRLFSKIANFSYKSSGLEFIYRHKLLIEGLENDVSAKLEEICKNFRSILAKLLQNNNKQLFVCQAFAGEDTIVINSSHKNWQSLLGNSILNTDSDAKFNLPDEFTDKENRLAWITNVDVNYCAVSFPAVAMSHHDAPKLEVLSAILRNGYLHSAIREQGGAYGSGASFNGNLGTFSFMSYRDPRLFDTFTDFKKSHQWLIKDANARLVEEAILNIISKIDNPSSPSGEAKIAFSRYLHGINLDMRKKYREAILATTLDELIVVANKYLVFDKASYAVVSHAGFVEQLKQHNFIIKSI